MTDPPSPFDDPEFVEMLNRAGIVHRPGMADEFMKQIEPLLAADGFDLNNQDQDVDLDDLDAAMGRAVERHNMELVTPVGDARILTVNVLREFVMAYGNSQLEDTIFNRLRPDPTKHHPSFSHLIGVATETLDTWYTDSSLRPALVGVGFSAVPPQIEPVVTHLVALARKGRTFSSIQRLLIKYNGSNVAMAGAYAVAVTLRAVAEQREQPVRSVMEALLPVNGVHSGFGSGAAFGAAAAEQVNSQDTVSQFEAWLLDNEDITISTPDDIDVFEMLVENALILGLDPFDPDDFDALVEVVLELPDPEVVSWNLAIMHDYVHFQLEGDAAALWEEPHELITELMPGDEAGLPAELSAIVDSVESLHVEERYATLISTPLVSGTAKLIEWLGTSQPVTGTGMPRRTDVGVVAAMIGIDAKGVAKVPPLKSADAAVKALDLSKPAPKQPTQYVQSAQEIDEVKAWWTALEIHGGVELLATRIKPGAMSDMLAAPQLDDLEAIEAFMMSYVCMYLLGAIEQPFSEASFFQTVANILELAQTQEPPDEVDAPSETELNPILSVRHLRSFERMGLLEIREAKPFIPEALRGVMVFGAMLCLAELKAAEEGSTF